jgi:hypothetical protein
MVCLTVESPCNLEDVQACSQPLFGASYGSCLSQTRAGVKPAKEDTDVQPHLSPLEKILDFYRALIRNQYLPNVHIISDYR